MRSEEIKGPINSYGMVWIWQWSLRYMSVRWQAAGSTHCSYGFLMLKRIQGRPHHVKALLHAMLQLQDQLASYQSSVMTDTQARHSVLRMLELRATPFCDYVCESYTPSGKNDVREYGK